MMPFGDLNVTLAVAYQWIQQLVHIVPFLPHAALVH